MRQVGQGGCDRAEVASEKAEITTVRLQQIELIGGLLLVSCRERMQRLESRVPELRGGFSMARLVLLGWILMLVVQFTATTVLAQKKAPDGAKILLLSGGQRQHHGYRDQAYYLADLLEDTGRYEVTIAEDAAILTTPALVKYDILIVNADRRDPEFKFKAGQQEALLNFVRSGKGYVSIHGADNSAPDWLPEWRVMLGGVFSHDTSGGRPDGKVRKSSYTIKVVEPAHPITRGLEDFPLDDELYCKMQMEPGVKPLATAEYDGTNWPVAWTRQFGEGRVFHTLLGHRDFGPDKPDPLRNPGLSKLSSMASIGWPRVSIARKLP